MSDLESDTFRRGTGTMAPAHGSDDLRTALILAAEALNAAHVELETIDSPEFPLDPPAKLVKMAEEHEAALATLKRVRAGVKAGNAGKLTDAKLKTIYAEEAARAAGSGEPIPRELCMAGAPVLDDVLRQVRDCSEALRRLALTSPAVREALDDVPGGVEW